MPSSFTAALHRLLPSPCYDRPFVCDGAPEACSAILIGENPATTTDTDWWSFWNDDKGFDLKNWRETYTNARKLHGLSPVSQTRLRINRLRDAGVNCLETNVFMNERLQGHGAGVANADLLSVALAELPAIHTVIAHGAEAHAYAGSRAWNSRLRIIKTKHFRLLSYAAIDDLATQTSAA